MHLGMARPSALAWRGPPWHGSRGPCRGEAARLVVAKPRTLSWRSRAPYCGEAAHLIVIERDVIEHGLSEDAPSLIGAVRTRPASPATRGRGRSLAARPCCLAHVKGACHWRMSLAHVTASPGPRGRQPPSHLASQQWRCELILLLSIVAAGGADASHRAPCSASAPRLFRTSKLTSGCR